MVLCMDRLVRAGGVVGLSLALAASALCGCGSARGRGERDAAAGRAIAIRMTAQPMSSLPARRVSALLDFDSPDDITFVTSNPPGTLAIDDRLARSGRASLLVPAGTRQISVKLASLLSGREFPADWTLAGAYFHCDRASRVTLSYEAGGRLVCSRSVTVAAGAWTPVMVDLAALADAEGDEVGALHLAFDPGSTATVRLDDFTLIDNHESVVDTTARADAGSAGGGMMDDRGWRVRRRGLYWVVEAPGRFAFVVPTAHAEQGGWDVAGAFDRRVGFASAHPPGTLTIYADGRMYWGGELRAVSPALADAAEQARQHASPAQVAVLETMGRVNRSTAGDANNDGYNETRGAYQVVSSGPRVEMTITPRTSVLSRPVFEISGLPPGEVLVTMEGMLIPGASRLANGDVLIEIPAQIARPTLVNVRAQ